MKKTLLVILVFLSFFIILIIGKSDFLKNISNKDNNRESVNKVSDKNENASKDNNGPLVIFREDMDEFWINYLPEAEIQNEWIYSTEQGYYVAIFGASKGNSRQGVVNTYTISDDKIIAAQQFLAPSKGGALSVMDINSPKDYNMKVQDEDGTIYLFNFFNGFAAHKDNINSDWKYWE